MKKNYILLLLIIIVGVFIMTSIGIIYKKVDNSKENKSYISNKVNNYEYKDIESGMNEIKDNGYLYLTYIGSKNIYNLEKYIYKTLKNTPIPLEVLAQKTNIPLRNLQSTLTFMELDGYIKKMPNNSYIKI